MVKVKAPPSLYVYQLTFANNFAVTTDFDTSICLLTRNTYKVQGF